VLYFGDQSGDFQTCRAQELLHSSGEFDVQLRRPPSDFSDLPHEFPDAFLVDMDLSRAAGNGKPVSYFGSTLAAELRMRNPSCPLFLVTREHVNGLKENLLEERVVVDHVVLKETLIREPEKQRAQMISLIEGFQTLQSVAHEPWHAVLERLGADEEEAHLLREAGPPFNGLRWTIPQTARWLRNVLMGYPGILYDEGRQEGIQEGWQKGILEGEQKGEQKGLREEALHLTQRLLTRRIGVLTPEQEDRLRKLSHQQLEQLFDAAYDFASMDDLHTWLDTNPPE
jgi:hypothetical protein